MDIVDNVRADLICRIRLLFVIMNSTAGKYENNGEKIGEIRLCAYSSFVVHIDNEMSPFREVKLIRIPFFGDRVYGGEACVSRKSLVSYGVGPRHGTFILMSRPDPFTFSNI